jgi:hypothetical protein
MSIDNTNHSRPITTSDSSAQLLDDSGAFRKAGPGNNANHAGGATTEGTKQTESTPRKEGSSAESAAGAADGQRKTGVASDRIGSGAGTADGQRNTGAGSDHTGPGEPPHGDQRHGPGGDSDSAGKGPDGKAAGPASQEKQLKDAKKDKADQYLPPVSLTGIEKGK